MSIVIDEKERVCLNCKYEYDDSHCIHAECKNFIAGYTNDGFVPSVVFLKDVYGCGSCKHNGTDLCSGCRLNVELPDLWESKERKE